MKICQVTPGLIEIPPKTWGAIEKIIWEYKLGLEKLGHTVDIKYLDDVNSNDYDIIHIHVANLALMAHERNIPYIFTFHDHHAYLYGQSSDLYKENLLVMKYAKQSIVPAEFLVKYFEEIPIYLPHGINLNDFTLSTEITERNGLLCVGNNGLYNDPTIDRKGFKYGIEAAIKLDMNVDIIGPKNVNKSFFDSHPELIGSPLLNIKYDASHKELLESYQKSKILIHATLAEAGHPPLTILEAMATGLPVIGTFMGANVLHPDCEITRDTDQVICSIQKVLENYEFYSNWYYNKSKEYSWDIIVKKLNDIYNKKSKSKDMIDISVKNMYDRSVSLYNKTKIKRITPENSKNIVYCTFINGPKVELLGNNSQEVYVQMIDKRTGNVVYDVNIKNNMWARARRKWYTPWLIRITDINTKESFDYNFDLTNAKVFIHFNSSALGDTIAWIPYVEEFRKIHNCNITCAMSWQNLFESEYPEITFVNIDYPIPSDTYASYEIDWCCSSPDYHPTDVRLIPLQQVASDILGRKYTEIKPKIKTNF